MASELRTADPGPRIGLLKLPVEVLHLIYRYLRPSVKFNTVGRHAVSWISNWNGPREHRDHPDYRSEDEICGHNAARDLLTVHKYLHAVFAPHYFQTAIFQMDYHHRLQNTFLVNSTPMVMYNLRCMCIKINPFKYPTTTGVSRSLTKLTRLLRNLPELSNLARLELALVHPSAVAQLYRNDRYVAHQDGNNQYGPRTMITNSDHFWNVINTLLKCRLSTLEQEVRQATFKIFRVERYVDPRLHIQSAKPLELCSLGVHSIGLVFTKIS
jgi:hypothetical protein